MAGPDVGPLEEVEVMVAGRAIRLVRPVEPDRLLDAPGVQARNLRDDYMPYWAYLWPGAHLLAEAVAARTWPPGTEALEIGCGLGLAGLAALDQGLRVRFTDYDDEALRLVARSARANGFDPARYTLDRLDWREPGPERYPLILGSDVLYEARLVPQVAHLIARMLAPGGEALLAGPDRVATRTLPAELTARGLRFEAQPVASAAPELGPTQGILHRVWRL